MEEQSIIPENLSEQMIEFNKVLGEFDLSVSRLETIVQRLQYAFTRGLSGEREMYHYSPVRMLPTHLSVIPDGSEVGRFFAIDLGGTNLRFLQISVVEGKLEPQSYCYEVPQSIMCGTGVELFDYVASCIEEGLERLGIRDKTIDYLGFTFSFPCNQLALNSGLLLRWTKGYSATGVEGEDVVKLLKDACARRKLLINDFILINDTTGTLLCGGFEDKHAKIGVINGTGTNACYLEEISRVHKWTNPTHHKRVIINTEWGAFGENSELEDYSTQIDKRIDLESINPNKQVFEKMISGMYIGEICRYLILDGINRRVLFRGVSLVSLEVAKKFPSSLISDVYNEELFCSRFKSLFGVIIPAEEFPLVFKICDMVSRRSANLCAAGLAAILKRIECPKGVIAADGSLFRKHPKFVQYVEETLRKLVPERDFKIILVNDGSGKGAALAACVASTSLNK